MLGLMAGAFIAFGAMFYTLVMTSHEMGLSPARLLGGIAFSLGLILVVVGGAELFTGDNFIVMAWAENKVTTLQLLRNWFIVYIANFVGAVGTAMLMFWSGALTLGDNAFAENAFILLPIKLIWSPYRHL
jgi:formate/nitrite transporter FocA (FNT family)